MGYYRLYSHNIHNIYTNIYICNDTSNDND